MTLFDLLDITKMPNNKFLQVEEKYSKIVMGMGDHSRLALCAFMVGLIAFNPFSSFFGGFVSESLSNDYSTRVDQRRILSDDDSGKKAYTSLIVKVTLVIQNY